jgi:hypothetical protein
MKRPVSDLIKHLHVSQKQNRRNFARAADRITRGSDRVEFSYGPNNLISALQDNYLEMVELVIAAQKGQGKKLASRLKETTESLVLNAIRFHLNFFQPSLLGLTERRALRGLVGKMKRTFAAKNADYGNAFRFWGVPGLVVRMGDKYLRLVQISRGKYRARVTDEHVPDTALDLANYGIMLLMLLEEGRSLRLGK